MKKSFLLLASILVTAGCSTPTITKNIPFPKNSRNIFDCSTWAARDTGFQIESTDSKSGTFSAVKIGENRFHPNYQAYAAIDKRNKVVQLSISEFNKVVPGQEAVDKLFQDFQSSIKKRCQ